MVINFESFKPDEFLKEVIHAAADQAPYGAGTVINYVVDTLFFPTDEANETESLWNQLEKQISAMTHEKVEDAVAQALGEMSAANMFGKLKHFGVQFRQLPYITNIDQKKLHLALLTNEATHLVSDIVNVPPASLHRMAGPLQVIAGCHIAAIMQLKGFEPDNYRHQSSLNNMAILYSDTAGMMFNRSMAWRRSMIAEGNGTLVLSDWGPDQPKDLLKEEMKRVEFLAHDKYYNNVMQPGRGAPVVSVYTPDIPKNRPSEEFGAAELRAYDELREYDKKVQGEWTEHWNGILLKVTKGFMNLVDWPGLNREKKGEIAGRPNQFAFPLQPSASPLHDADDLRRIDLFLEQQMDHFAIAGPRYAQTYRPAEPIQFGERDNLFLRADTYDASVACIYFQERGDLQRARDLGDALVQAMNHDPKGGGRIVAATMVDRLIDPNQNHHTSIFVPDGGRRDIGNMSWAGIALTRLFAKTESYRYLHAAEVIGQWILDECTVEDSWGGFSGGEDHWGKKEGWRAVEHNVDCVSFFDNLFTLTGREAWSEARESARTLVKACRVEGGYYLTGTGLTQELNTGVVPTDTQSWTTLARVAPDDVPPSLHYMIDTMETESAGFVGTKFARDGREVQNEATAGAAMALWMAREQDPRFQESAERYLASLSRQIREANHATGYGVVATPAEEADTGPGLGWKYFNYQHVASTAWTGMALLFKERVSANPYASIEEVRGG